MVTYRERREQFGHGRLMGQRIAIFCDSECTMRGIELLDGGLAGAFWA